MHCQFLITLNHLSTNGSAGGVSGVSQTKKLTDVMITKLKSKQMKKGTSSMNIKFILSRLSACAIAIALSIGIAGCDSKEHETGRAIIGSVIGSVYPDPPISITIRTSLLTGYVLQLHNTSSVQHVYNVHVKNEAKGQEMNSSFGIPPNGEQEVGILEMDWAFEAGEKGCVSVDGYAKKCYFEILPSGQYKTWYDL